MQSSKPHGHRRPDRSSKVSHKTVGLKGTCSAQTACKNSEIAVRCSPLSAIRAEMFNFVVGRDAGLECGSQDAAVRGAAGPPDKLSAADNPSR